MIQKLLLSASLCLMLTIVGCGGEESSAPREGGEGAWRDNVADQARLIEQLPASTVAYLRIPTPWGLAAPKGNALGRGLDTPANVAAITRLQAGLPELLESELGQLAPVLTLLLERMRSPLEIALVGEGPQPLEADVIIEARFDFETATELDAALAGITSQASMLQLIEPAAGNGTGQILATMFPIFYDFDASTGRARFVTGMAASPEGLAASRTWPAAAESPLHDFERRIDASRHGLFLWADSERLAPLMRQGLDDAQLAQLEELGVFDTRRLALGMGSSDGTARLAVLAEGDDGRAWRLTLPSAGPVTSMSSGTPDAVFGLRVPDEAWLRTALTEWGEDADLELAEISSQLQAEIGMDFETLVQTFSGRWLFVDDDNGSYLVHEGGNAETWARFWEVLSRRFDIATSAIDLGERTGYHVVIPGIDVGDAMDGLSDDNPVLALVVRRSLDVGTHLFWMAEDDRILIAAVPQVLMARAEFPGDVAIEDWLSGAGVDAERGALFGALTVDEAPRRNYHTYIGWLIALADIVDVEIDVTAFPTARELDLPDSGTLGFGVDFTDGRLGATLAFENQPADFFYAGGGSFGGVAVLGVIAAVAVPAYQDYLVRSRLSTAFVSTSEFRALVERHVAETGALPDTRTAAAWAEAVPRSSDTLNVIWQSEPAGLRLILAGGSGVPENAKLVISPQVEAGRLTGWRCDDSTVDDKHLPAGCR
jgi:hypothetical protein